MTKRFKPRRSHRVSPYQQATETIKAEFHRRGAAKPQVHSLKRTTTGVWIAGVSTAGGREFGVEMSGKRFTIIEIPAALGRRER